MVAICTYDSFSEPLLKELLTVYNIEFNSSYDREDLLDLFKNKLLPILKSQAFNNYFQKHGVHNSSDDDSDNDSDNDYYNKLMLFKKNNAKIHLCDLHHKDVAKLVDLFFQYYIRLLNKDDDFEYLKSLTKQRFLKQFLSNTFIRDAIKLLNFNKNIFTASKKSWEDFIINMRLFVSNISPRIFNNIDAMIEKIGSIPPEDIIYWDTVLISESKSIAIVADKSVINLGSSMDEHLFSFTRSSPKLQYSPSTPEFLEDFQKLLMEKVNNSTTFSKIKICLSKQPNAFWHLLSCLDKTDCSTIFTGNDSINKTSLKNLSYALSLLKGKDCKLNVVNFKNGGLLLNPIQHGAKYIIHRLQDRTLSPKEARIVPSADFMLEEADKYIKSHKNGERLTFTDGYFATCGKTLNIR